MFGEEGEGGKELCVCFIQAPTDSRPDESWAVCFIFCNLGLMSAQVWRGRNLCSLFFVLLRAGVNHPELGKYTPAVVNKDILHLSP